VREEQMGLRISFDGLSDADANRAAAELRGLLLDVDDTVEVSIRRDNPDTQDVGATLVLLFGSGAAVAIAEGIRAFLAKRGTYITIKGVDGMEIVASGEAASRLDAPALVDAIKRNATKH